MVGIAVTVSTEGHLAGGVGLTNHLGRNPASKFEMPQNLNKRGRSQWALGSKSTLACGVTAGAAPHPRVPIASRIPGFRRGADYPKVPHLTPGTSPPSPPPPGSSAHTPPEPSRPPVQMIGARHGRLGASVRGWMGGT